MTVDYQNLAAEQIWEVRRKLNVLGFPTAIENAIYELAVDERATTLEQAARIEALEKAHREWRSELMNAWASDHRATMTALLEDGPGK